MNWWLFLFVWQDTEDLLEDLKKDREAVAEVRQIVEAEEAAMKKETQIVQKYHEVCCSIQANDNWVDDMAGDVKTEWINWQECEKDLASVMPLLRTAIQSLDMLEKADISEIRQAAVSLVFNVETTNVAALMCIFSRALLHAGSDSTSHSTMS